MFEVVEEPLDLKPDFKEKRKTQIYLMRISSRFCYEAIVKI